MKIPYSLVLCGVQMLCIPLAYGCDICGCATGGNALGVLVLSNKYLLDIRWHQQSYL